MQTVARARPKMPLERVQAFLVPELTVNEPGTRGRSILSIILSIIVLLLISSMIVAAIVIINPDITNFTSKQGKVREAITLEEALLGELSPKDFSYQWLPEDETTNVGDQILYEDMKSLFLVTLPTKLHQETQNNSSHASHIQTQQTVPAHAQNIQHNFRPNISLLVSNTSLLSSIDYHGYKLSPSKRYLLIWTARKRQYRYSSTAKYFLYDIKLDLISLISTKPPVGQPATGSSQQTHNHYENLDTASLYLYSTPLISPNDDEYSRFQVVEWFSSRSKENPNELLDSLVLIQNNDIYTLNNVAGLSSSVSEFGSNSVRPSRPIRLTVTGRSGEIFNGVPDWLYEEEILTDSTAFQISPSADYLAYLSFNDSLVNQMPFSIYGDRVIPQVRKIRYPKAGQPNPLVSVRIIENFSSISSQDNSISSFRDVKLNLPSNLARQQHYINRINWLSNDKLALVWSNRNQNESYVIVCSRNNASLLPDLIADQWQCVENLRMQANGGWLDISDDIHPLDDNYYLARLPKFEGDDVGFFKHIAKVSVNSANNFVYLTGGRKEVIIINGIDKKNSLVYYTSTMVNEPGQRQVFVVGYDESIVGQLRQRSEPVGVDPAFIESTVTSSCLTCDHHPDSCLYNHIRLSHSTKHYIFQCDGPDVPRTELRTTLYRTPKALRKLNQKLTAKSSDSLVQETLTVNSLLWVIEDNLDLRNKLEYGKAMPLTARLKIPIQNTNHHANVLLLLPPQMGPNTMFRATSALSSVKEPLSPQPRFRRDLNAQSLEPGNLGDEESEKRANLFANLNMDDIKEYASQMQGGQQYPMIVDVYGGPGSQRVDYRFNVYIGNYFASNRRTVYAMIDGRGSGYQGSKRLYELYHKFGTIEIQDQIDVTSHLTKLLTFVDPTKVAIWGWSYGGYAAAMALAQSNARAMEAMQAHVKSFRGKPELFANISSPLESSRGRPHLTTKAEALAARTRQVGAVIPAFRGVFECAASVAPVTNWIYYDSAYTEKYMSSPWANERYDEISTREHLMPQSVVDAPRSSSQAQNLMAANKWTHLNQSSLNDSVRRQHASQLLELIVRSAQTAASTNSTLQHVVSNFVQRNPTHSPLYNELNDRYKRASLLDQIGNIDRKRFLLVHGTADDNVHFQQSIMLMKQLIRRNIMFETRLYPDQDHSIDNKADKLHLGATLSNFFAECFDMAY